MPAAPVGTTHTPPGAVLIWICALSVSLLGCGGAHIKHSAAAKLCLPQAVSLVSQAVGPPQSRIATAPSKGNNGEPQCSFKTKLQSGRGFDVTVNVDNSPQPYAVLARTIEERQQVFSPTRLVPAPVNIAGLGLLAAWFPDSRQLMSTEAVALVTTTVRWPGATNGTEVRFATRLSRLYLGKNKPALAKTFP